MLLFHRKGLGHWARTWSAPAVTGPREQLIKCKMVPKRVVLLVLTVFGATLILAGYRWSSAPLAVDITRVLLLRPAEIQTLFSATGYVVPLRKASLSSKITGRLAWLGVSAGSRVTKGQLLATLEDDEYRGAVNQAKAQSSAAHFQLRQSQAALKEARRDYERALALYERGYYSRSLLEKAEIKVEIGDAAANAGVANLNAARAALVNTEVALNQTRITAPFGGVITSLNANLGDIVTPFTANLEAKGAVLTIVDPASFQVEVEIAEAQLSRVEVGNACLIRLDAFPNLRFEGTVSHVVPNVDRARGSAKVSINFKHDPALNVVSDMSAHVDFLPKKPSIEDLAAVPVVDREALAGAASHPAVYRLERGHAIHTRVITGKSFGQYVEIKAGLIPGQTVVLRPSPQLADGMAITETH